MIYEKVLSSIKKYNLIEDGDRIVVGISGGPDSMALLHVLNRLKQQINIQIYAAHLNHQLRGINSQEDAFFVTKYCEKIGITCFVKSEDVSKFCRENSLSIEEGARILRYNMFDEIKNRTKSNKIAVGHNLNDQAETVLMRILRGTGLSGLKGIEIKRNDGIIRPLLEVKRCDIESYCKEYDLNPRIDESNLETIYTRNKIRLELIPYLTENFNSNVVESLVRMSSSLKFDNDYIEETSLKIFNEVANISQNRIDINIQSYIGLHSAIKLRVLRLGIKQILGDTKGIEQKHIYDILEFEDDSKINKMLNLPRNIFVYRKANSIVITNQEIVIDEVEFCYNIPKEGFINIKEIDLNVKTQVISINSFKGMKKDNESIAFDLEKIKGTLTISNRKQGDKIKLQSGTKKIKDMFIDLKIPKEERSKVPIIKDESEVLAVSNLRISENYKITDQTKEVLKITFNKL